MKHIFSIARQELGYDLFAIINYYADMSAAQKLVRECVRKKYKGC
jgi:hypothetical protein